MTGDPVTVFKGSKRIEMDEAGLRKGDLVAVQAGDLVPADLKLIEAHGLEVDEFELTGEILPLVKKADDDEGKLFMGSRVVRGTGIGIVSASGDQTEFGKILKEESAQNRPFELRIFSKKALLPIAFLIPALIMYWARTRDLSFGFILFIGIAVMLIFLQSDRLFAHLLFSFEQRKLKRANLEIRDLRILDTLREADILCLDKTGVLTTRRLDIRKVYFADRILEADEVMQVLNGQVAHVLRLAFALSNDSHYYDKINQANPIDKALIAFAQKTGVDIQDLFQRAKRVYEKPFDSENRYMGSGFEIGDQKLYFVKGDPEIILKMCTGYQTSNGAQKQFDSEFWTGNQKNLERISENGDTAIALAYAEGDAGDIPESYTFLCTLQLENSLQPGARELVSKATQLGMRCILMTGDRAETATKVGEKSGITKNSRIVLTGRLIDRMALSEVARQTSYCSIFAELLPSQKGVLIRLLQQNGHGVIMVGDGPNDGIALKVADIGISFLKNSSPIARRLAKVLINEISDIVALIESTANVKKRAHSLKLIRILTIVGSIAGMYLWALGL